MEKKNFTQINNLGKFWENFIIVSIILVLVITFLDEYAILARWDLTSRKYLALLSFIFDFIFSVEFGARMTKTSRHSAAGHYFFYERGWVDLLSSVPLLLLNSGPEFLIQFFPEMFHIHGGELGFFSTMKVVKAIRITRILRFLRMIKFLGKIQNANSHMANRHIAVISTISIMSVIIVFAVVTVTGVLGFTSWEKQQIRLYSQLFKNLETITGQLPSDDPSAEKTVKDTIGKLFYQLGPEDSQILQIYYKESLILSQYTEDYLEKTFHYLPDKSALLKFGDIHTYRIQSGDFILYLNLYPLYEEKARVHIFLFIMIVVVIFAMMTIYTRHFVQSISDPIHIMDKGFSDPNFNLEVKIQKAFAEDEIFDLAEEFNEKWLPKKMQEKEQDSQNETGGLTLDDFLS